MNNIKIKLKTSELTGAAIDYTIIFAYERGLDDGFFQGEPNNNYLGPRDELRVAYKQLTTQLSLLTNVGWMMDSFMT
jgi:hypothetical protein